MADVFGHTWTSSYGDLPSDTWLAGLIDMSVEELQTGVLACLSWEPEWPPTLPQFRALCRPRVEPSHQVFQRLPEPDEDRARRKASGMAHLAALREEGRYREWLAQHAPRLESDIEVLLRHVRAMRRAHVA